MKEKDILKINVSHYEGLDIREEANCILKITNYHLKYCDIRGQVIKEISLKDIINVGVINDKHLKEKNKSVIGRGIAGGLLFGSVGLVLGGLSGTGTKQIKEDVQYIVVNYNENNENKVISVYVNGAFSGTSFVKKLNNIVNLSKEENKCPNCGKEYNISEFKCSNCGQMLKSGKKLKVIFGVVIGIVIFIVFIAIIGLSVSNGTPKEVNIIERIANVEKDQAITINDILKDIGIEEFKNMSADSENLDGFEGVGSKGYRMETDFSDNVILYLDSNNNVICVRYADKDYYRNGQVLNKFD